MDLNLYEEEEKLEPIRYSTGLNQVDVIENILEAFEGNSMVYLKGVVGSGKSVIGIRTALEMGGGVVSVPTKMLSKQYRSDYSKGEKYFFLDGLDKKADIDMVQGRGNFQCPYLEREKPHWPEWKKTCQGRSLPCTRPLGKEESRLDAINDCPWGGCTLPPEVSEVFTSGRQYEGLNGSWSIVLRKGADGKECPYWSQFRSYRTADVVAMNSAKFKIETWIKRLPQVPLAVIDEGDLFLDNICSKVVLSERKITKLKNEIDEWGSERLARLLKEEDFRWEDNISIEGLKKEVDRIWSDLLEENIHPFECVELFRDFLEELDLENRLYWNLSKISRHKDQCSYEDKRDEDNPRVNFFIANPAPLLDDLIDSLKANVLMMSATAPSKSVLSDVFGITPTIIKGETKFPGKLICRKTGREKEVNHDKWKKDSFRRIYDWARDDILKKMKKPGFVPVHATKYLPDHVDERELVSNTELEEDGVSYSTKMSRGADLPEMESICLLKYPYPSLGDPLIQAVRKKLGRDFWKYYRDMSRREFVQQVGRIMRSPDAVKEFHSPDLTCHKMLKNHWKGEMEVRNY